MWPGLRKRLVGCKLQTNPTSPALRSRAKPDLGRQRPHPDKRVLHLSPQTRMVPLAKPSTGPIRTEQRDSPHALGGRQCSQLPGHRRRSQHESACPGPGHIWQPKPPFSRNAAPSRNPARDGRRTGERASASKWKRLIRNRTSTSNKYPCDCV